MKPVVRGAFAVVVALSTVALASQHDVVAEPPAATTQTIIAEPDI